MRILLLLRGAPGCGKSVWVDANGLKPYALAADDIRLMYQSPVMETDGRSKISGEHDNAVWKNFFRILRVRMQRGDFTVVDATNSRTEELNRYKELCSEFRYRVYCVDFTDIPIGEVKRRNGAREPYRRVPEKVIDTMYARFATQKVPSGIKVIKPEELDGVWLKLRDFSHYKKVHHIGDIHGCNTPLQKYFSDNGGIKDDEMYIFTGDYIDRGMENAQVVAFLLSIMERKNVLLLEGNHENGLWQWAKDEAGQDDTGKLPPEFELTTKPALEEAGISKKEVRNLYRRLGQCAYYQYDGNIYLVTHGGISTIPDNLSLIATEQMICGTGRFEDVEEAAAAFRTSMPENYFQIFGHRNLKQVPLKADERVFNLEGQVEYGGALRCLQIGHEGIRPVEISNPAVRGEASNRQYGRPEGDADPRGCVQMFMTECPSGSSSAEIKQCHISENGLLAEREGYEGPEEEKRQLEPDEESMGKNSMADVLHALRNNKYIMEKKFGNISSFNYTDEAFYDKVWNSQTIKARGLYLDTAKGKVAARAYDKFFNIGECAQTKLDSLQRRMRFPASAYVKENGFLGIISYNEYENDFLIACKSTTDSRFALWLKEMLISQVPPEHLERMKDYIRENDVSFVFECVDMEHDPHIIEYPKNRLVLLDIVHNEMEFKKYGYEEMCAIAGRFGLDCKEKACEIQNWQDFFDWHYEVLKEGYVYPGRTEGNRIEGFVIEDSNGFMTKLKLPYYKFWKQMRAVAREVAKKGFISHTETLTTPTANRFYGWLREKYASGELRKMPKDICGLRKRFYMDYGDGIEQGEIGGLK